MKHLCTISTVSHMHKTYALADSLQQGDDDFLLHVMVVDGPVANPHPKCRIWQPNDIYGTYRAKEITEKYKGNSDKLRWCLKPVFMLHLLEQKLAESVLYADNDLYFFGSYLFLYDLLQQHSLLLTPHYYRYNPNKEQNWFEANFRVGLYNAGFVGASAVGIKTLQWWADSCYYRCEKNAWRGLFDDQKYLDLVPVIDEQAHVLRHKGCNVAGWNIVDCPRSEVNGQVVIDGRHPLVFVHFNASTFREIQLGNDPHLVKHMDIYWKNLLKYAPGLQQPVSTTLPLADRVKFTIWKIATDLGL